MKNLNSIPSVGLLVLASCTPSAHATTITLNLTSSPYASQQAVLNVQRDLFENGGWGYRWFSPINSAGNYSDTWSTLDFSLHNIIPVGSTITAADLVWVFSGLSATTDWYRPGGPGSASPPLGGADAHQPYDHGTQTPCDELCSPANMKYVSPSDGFWADNVSLSGSSTYLLNTGNSTGSLNLLSIWNPGELLTNDIEFTGHVYYNVGRPFFDGEGRNADTEFDIWGHAQANETATLIITFDPPAQVPATPASSMPEPATYLLVGGMLAGIGMVRRLKLLSRSSHRLRGHST